MGLVAADGGPVTWPLMISLQLAKEYALTGDRIPARRAAEIGLVNHVCPDDEVLDQATGLRPPDRRAAPAGGRGHQADPQPPPRAGRRGHPGLRPQRRGPVVHLPGAAGQPRPAPAPGRQGEVPRSSPCTVAADRLSGDGPLGPGIFASIPVGLADRTSFSRSAPGPPSRDPPYTPIIGYHFPSDKTPISRRSAGARQPELARAGGGAVAGLGPTPGRDPGAALPRRRPRAVQLGLGQGLHRPGGRGPLGAVAPQLLPVLRGEARAAAGPVRGVGPHHDGVPAGQDRRRGRSPRAPPLLRRRVLPPLPPEARGGVQA